MSPNCHLPVDHLGGPVRPRGCSLLPRALDPPRRAGALGCRRAPRRLCLVALATPRPVCSSPRPNLALGTSRAPLSCSLRPNWPPQPAVGAAPAWMLHQAQLLLALCHACQHHACLLAPCGSQRPQSSVLTSPSPLRHVRTCLAAVGDVSWVQVLAKLECPRTRHCLCLCL